MMDTIRKFLKGRNLVLSTEKTKILVFNKKVEKKECQNWEKNKIEEVQSFKYLDFVFTKKGEYTYHVKKGGKGATNKVYLEERIRRDNFNIKKYCLDM